MIDYSKQIPSRSHILFTHAMVMSLDDLQEKRGTVLHGFGEDLQEVTIVVVVYQDLELLQLKLNLQ